jgi:hypothetical protein
MDIRALAIATTKKPDVPGLLSPGFRGHSAKPNSPVDVSLYSSAMVAVSAIEPSFGGSGCFSSESRYAVPRVSPAGKIVNFLRVNAREVSVLFTGRLRLECLEVESHHGAGMGAFLRSASRHNQSPRGSVPVKGGGATGVVLATG